MIIREVVETADVVAYLKSRNLIVQYKKTKEHILMGHITGAQLRKRQPKSENIWYFRISKKYRVYAYLDDTVLKVFRVDDHQ